MTMFSLEDADSILRAIGCPVPVHALRSVLFYEGTKEVILVRNGSEWSAEVWELSEAQNKHVILQLEDEAAMRFQSCIPPEWLFEFRRYPSGFTVEYRTQLHDWEIQLSLDLPKMAALRLHNGAEGLVSDTSRKRMRT